MTQKVAIMQGNSKQLDVRLFLLFSIECEGLRLFLNNANIKETW